MRSALCLVLLVATSCAAPGVARRPIEYAFSYGTPLGIAFGHFTAAFRSCLKQAKLDSKAGQVSYRLEARVTQGRTHVTSAAIELPNLTPPDARRIDLCVEIAREFVQKIDSPLREVFKSDPGLFADPQDFEIKGVAYPCAVAQFRTLNPLKFVMMNGELRLTGASCPPRN